MNTIFRSLLVVAALALAFPAAAQRTDRLDGIQTGLAIKAPVKAVSVSNLTLSGAQTVNGVALVAEDRVLVAAQTDATENGIYVVKTTAWTRASDFDGNRDVADGTLVTVQKTTGANTFYQVDATDPVVIGTSSISFLQVSDPNVQWPITALETAGGLTTGDISDSYEPGNVLRYGCQGDGSTDDATCFTNAFLSGHEVFVPATTVNKYVIGSAQTITEGTVLRGESRETVLSYTGSAATWMFTATLVTMEKGLTIDNLTLESATNGVNGIKCIECRNARLTRLNLVPDSGGDDFAIGVLFDDDAASSPQVGTAWNYMEDYYIEGATDACLRLDTQGTLTWTNRNFIGHGRLEGCGIGLDLVRGDTNIIFANPQNCTTGIALGADADYNYLVSFEESSATASITVAAGAVRNTIIGSFATGTITDNGTNNLWLAQSYYRIPAFSDGTIRLEQTSGNANISVPVGFTGNINFSVQDSDTPSTTQVLSLVGDVVDPYVSVPTRLNATYLGTTPVTTAALSDIANAINTNDGKVDGACVWDTTADIIMCATGAADGSTWVGEKAGSTITLTPT